MIDMKLSTEEKKDFCSPRPIDEAPKYPYGLRITLGPEELKKLGLQELPEVDTIKKLIADVKVVEVASDEKGEHRVSLQIIEMSLNKKEKEGDEPKELSSEKLLYGVS